MVELLIALAISSFLIIGITQIYIDNKRNHGFQQSQGEIQEANRFISLLFDTYLNKAGYSREPYMPDAETFKAASPDSCLPFKDGQSITKTKSSIGTGICIRYTQIQSEELDCAGNATESFDDTKPFDIDNQAPVVIAALFVDDGKLYCQSGSGDKVELLTGVAGLRMVFGINPTSETAITRTMTADDWDDTKGQILQIRYEALIASTNNQRGEGDSAVLDNWLVHASADEKTAIEAADTGQLYQVASNTVTLRNLTP